MCFFYVTLIQTKTNACPVCAVLSIDTVPAILCLKRIPCVSALTQRIFFKRTLKDDFYRVYMGCVHVCVHVHKWNIGKLKSGKYHVYGENHKGQYDLVIESLSLRVSETVSGTWKA